MAIKYSEQFPGKVRYMEHHGHLTGGMSASRNWGFPNAMGNYIAFLHADDVWYQQKLEQ